MDGGVSQVGGGGEANAHAFKCVLHKWPRANLNTADNLKQTKCRHRDSTRPLGVQLGR